VKRFIVIVSVLMLLVAFGCKKANAFDIGPDFKLEGDVTLGYVISSSSDVNLPGNKLVSIDNSQSKWGYMADIKLLFKNTFRPWIYLSGISGYSASNEWEIGTQTFSLGADYLFYNTKYGSAFARVSYTNWQSTIDATAFGLGMSVEPESDTWMMGLGWKF
jgi:hypothetical protein